MFLPRGRLWVLLSCAVYGVLQGVCERMIISDGVLTASYKFLGSKVSDKQCRRLVLCCFNKRKTDGKQQKQPGTQKQQQSSGQGFAALAALLEKQKSVTKPKVDAKNHGEYSQLRGKKNTPSKDDGKTVERYTKQTLTDEDVESYSQQTSTQPSTEQGLFSQAVLAALQMSAVKRQQKRNKKKVSDRKPVVKQEVSGNPIEDARPIVVKSEWGAQIEEFERKLQDLKQQYYKKV